MLKLDTEQQQILDENKHKALYAFDCGRGKTIMSLTMATGKVLVIVQKQQKVDRTFEEELVKFGIDRDITIITQDAFRKTWDTLPHYDSLIIDEAHTALNGAVTYYRFKTFLKPSKLCSSILSYIKKHDPSHIYGLTATLDVSPLAVFYMARALGINYNQEDYIKAFYFLLNGRYKPVKTVSTRERTVKIIKSIGYCLAIKDKPISNYIVHYIYNTKEQDDAIKKTIEEYPNELQQVGKVYQIEQGVLKGNQFTESKTFPTSKDEYIKKYASEHKQLVIFAHYTEQIDNIENLLVQYKTYRLTGKTKKSERDKMIRHLQTEDEYILIVNSKICSGWGLPKCPTMLFASRYLSTYSAHAKIQAEGRIQRTGNLKVNLYIDLVAKGSIDEALYNANKNGKKFNQKIYIK